jgi:hypothetical protein
MGPQLQILGNIKLPRSGKGKGKNAVLVGDPLGSAGRLSETI